MSARTKVYEGFRSRPYKDTKGKWTVGYGFNLHEPHVAKLVPNEVKLGLRDLTPQEADAIYDPLYAKAQLDAAAYVGGNTWKKLDPARQEVLTDMSYQMGLPSLSKFTDTNAAIQKGDYTKAAQEILNSKYAREDAPRRAKDNAKLFLSGQIKPISPSKGVKE